MAKRAQGYRIRKPANGAQNYLVRFRIDGKRYELSTGTGDRTVAEREGRRIYAETIRQGKPPESGAAFVFELTHEVNGEWLAQLAKRPKTVKTYRELSTRWRRTIRDWSALGLQRYINARLQVSLAKTVKTDCSALRNLLAWLVDSEYMPELPDPMPAVPKGALGKQSKRRTRCAAPELTEKEVRAFLAKLPERSDGGRWKKPELSFWVRPRCELLYELALRPDTVDRLSVPQNWSPGSTHLRITPDVDKEGAARDLLLTPRALAVLKQCATKPGVIFGEHKYYRLIRKAAKGTIGAGKAEIFTGQHLRSARATHMLDNPKITLKAVSRIMGHAKVSTTARYIRATAREADEALAAMG